MIGRRTGGRGTTGGGVGHSGRTAIGGRGGAWYGGGKGSLTGGGTGKKGGRGGAWYGGGKGSLTGGGTGKKGGRGVTAMGGREGRFFIAAFAAFFCAGVSRRIHLYFVAIIVGLPVPGVAIVDPSLVVLDRTATSIPRHP
jgi:hypothetical protein